MVNQNNIRSEGYDAYWIKRLEADACPYDRHNYDEILSYISWQTGWNEAWTDLNEK